MTQPPADTQRQPPSHVLLLNKFNVLPHHALVVTSAFEHQTEALTVEDLDATWRALDAYPPPGGLAFFNCGDASGHSQPHKHVQLVPLPLGPSAAGHSVPIQPLVEAALAAARPAPGAVFAVRELPFRNYCIALPPGGQRPQELLASHSKLRALALADCPPGQQPSFNLLLTRAWMLALPRRQETGLGLPLNALSFAGTLLVRSAGDLEHVRASPMGALEEAGVPW